jgi:hypothetical protein
MRGRGFRSLYFTEDKEARPAHLPSARIPIRMQNCPQHIPLSSPPSPSSQGPCNLGGVTHPPNLLITPFGSISLQYKPGDGFHHLGHRDLSLPLLPPLPHLVLLLRAPLILLMLLLLGAGLLLLLRPQQLVLVLDLVADVLGTFGVAIAQASALKSRTTGSQSERHPSSA